MRPADLEVGTLVDYHSVIGGPVTEYGMVVAMPSVKLPDGQWVTWLIGKSGYVAVESVSEPVMEVP